MTTRRLTMGAILLVTFVIFAGTFFFLRSPTPVIEIKAEPLLDVGPITITNTLFTSWVVMLTLFALVFWLTRRQDLTPRGKQNVIEAVIEAIYNLIVSVAGEKNGRRFFPVVATFLIYITFANWMALLPIFNAIGYFEPLEPEHKVLERTAAFDKAGGLYLVMPGARTIDIEGEVDEAACAGLEEEAHEACLVHEREKLIEASLVNEKGEPKLSEGEQAGVLVPFFRSINTDLMTPASFAIMSAIFVEFWGISTLGFLTYGSKFFNFGRMVRGLASFNLGELFNGFIEAFVGLLELAAELARLVSFSFRLFGNMLAGEILLLVMTFLVPTVVPLAFYGLEVFVGLIQAFIFGMLTLVFGVMAVAPPHGEAHGEHGEAHAPAH